MAATIWENIDQQSISFFRKTWKTWWPYHDHGMNLRKHDNHDMIMPWIMTTMQRNMAAMPSSWHDHDRVSPWSWYDYGKIMAWQPCFSNPGGSPYLHSMCYVIGSRLLVDLFSTIISKFNSVRQDFSKCFYTIDFLDSIDMFWLKK